MAASVTGAGRVVRVSAPIRLCDNGGWTDTWFAGHGQVFHMAASPLVHVAIESSPRESRADRVVIDARNFGDRYAFPLNAGRWLKHPLIEASIAFVGVPEHSAVEVVVWSDTPPGASLGTSASVAVALIAALDELRGGEMPPGQLAAAAHHVEMNVLGWQCGIQDQLCAAYGGINFIEMHRFPEANVTQLRPPAELLAELERRLVLVYLGASHRSSDIHRAVIRELEHDGPDCRRLEDLRHAAERSRDALLSGDLERLGSVMVENTEAQRRLHPALIGETARQVIEAARAHHASGWKVNGAGGDGGSVTILLGPGPDARAGLLAAIERGDRSCRSLPVRLMPHGVEVRAAED